MVPAVFVVIALLLGFGLGTIPSQRRNPTPTPLPPPVNVIGGTLVLPEPDDPRWERKREMGCDTGVECKKVMMRFGRVEACIDHGLRIGGVDPGMSFPEERERIQAYVRAVRAGYAANLAMADIDSVPERTPDAPEQLLLSST